MIQPHGTTVDLTVRVPMDAFMTLQVRARESSYPTVQAMVEALIMNAAGIMDVDDRILMFYALGFPDAQIAKETGMTNRYIAKLRQNAGLPANKLARSRRGTT